MEFRKCTIGGKIYGDNGFSPESEGARGARLRQERETAETNEDLGEKKVQDRAAEEKQFLARRNEIFEEYKTLIQSQFDPKYSSLDIEKLTFADPEVFKDLYADTDELDEKTGIMTIDEKEPLTICQESPKSQQQHAVKEFFTAVSLCHTAVVERIDKHGQVIDDSLADDLEDGTTKPEPDIIVHEKGQSSFPKSGSKTSTVNDSLESSNPSITTTDGESSVRPTPVSSSATKRSRFRQVLNKHKLRITNRSSRLSLLRSDRRGSRGPEFDAVPGQKARNIDTTVEEQLAYKSESPDESALVTAVKDVGFTFLKRKGNIVTVDILGQLYDYELLNVIDFNSTRKRMSVIVRRPEPWNDIIVYCKGADNVIIERLRPGQETDISELCKDIEAFSNEGLRTLVFAYKIIPDEEYDAWSEQLQRASTATENRADGIDEVNEKIEKGFTLLGATAIEDELQQQVPECIEALRNSGINVWVLTGDKVETAINIGYASNLLGNNSKLWILRGNPESAEVLSDFEDMITKMDREREELNAEVGKDSHRRSIRPPPEYAFVVDGLALKHLLETEESKARLLQVVLVCKSVVCCRVSPLQKALVVELVRRGQGAVTLAVGDGANDVSMIQAANIGVGISGQEGAQASMSADYAIAQFRFLEKLLVVQGHWSYDRISEMILNFFYKNVVWVFGALWFQIFSGFSANIFYDYSFLQLYNVVFTVAPTCVIGKCLPYPILNYSLHMY
jgi:phospholipid-translocating ATPase